MKTPKICSVEGCSSRAICRGWCDRHYRRWLKHGDPLVLVNFSSPEESFKARTEWQGECLIWTGAVTSSGYGNLYVRGGWKSAHRYAWEQVNGSIPNGLWLDHICHTPTCVNTLHLRLATSEENATHRAGPNPGRKEPLPRNVRVSGSGFQVVMSKRGKTYLFGTYRTIDEADRVATQKREELFGEFAGRG